VGSVLVKTENELKGVSEKKGALSQYAEVKRSKPPQRYDAGANIQRNDYVRFLAK
jgi:hypothetical protein